MFMNTKVYSLYKLNTLGHRNYDSGNKQITVIVIRPSMFLVHKDNQISKINYTKKLRVSLVKRNIIEIF